MMIIIHDLIIVKLCGPNGNSPGKTPTKKGGGEGAPTKGNAKAKICAIFRHW